LRRSGRDSPTGWSVRFALLGLYLRESQKGR
jgi:hypothetical protein